VTALRLARCLSESFTKVSKIVQHLQLYSTTASKTIKIAYLGIFVGMLLGSRDGNVVGLVLHETKKMS